MAFNEDLLIGELAEDYVADKLELAWNTLFQKEKDLKSCDLVDIKGRHVEVKHDRQWKETGNIALEIEYNGKPSGIMTTKATHIAYVLDMQVYITKTETLLKWITHNKLKKVKGGDGMRSKFLLIPLQKFRQVFEEI